MNLYIIYSYKYAETFELLLWLITIIPTIFAGEHCTYTKSLKFLQ